MSLLVPLLLLPGILGFDRYERTQSWRFEDVAAEARLDYEHGFTDGFRSIIWP